MDADRVILKFGEEQSTRRWLNSNWQAIHSLNEISRTKWQSTKRPTELHNLTRSFFSFPPMTRQKLKQSSGASMCCKALVSSLLMLAGITNRRRQKPDTME